MNIVNMLTPFEKELAYHYKLLKNNHFDVMKLRMFGKKAPKLFPSLFQLTISKEYDDMSNLFDVSIVDVFGGKVYTEILCKGLTFEKAYEKMNELHEKTNIKIFI